MSKCIPFLWIVPRAHKFEARYDETATFPPGAKLTPPFPDIIEAAKNRTQTYRHDICVRCGETRKP